MSSQTSETTQIGNVKSVDGLSVVSELEECDFSRLLERPRALNMERQRSSDERSMTELPIGYSPRFLSRNPDIASRVYDNLDSLYSSSPSRRSGYNTPKSQNVCEPNPMVSEAWEALRRSLVYFRCQPVGTIAALDSSEENLNYDQVFVRDFVPSGFAFLMNGQPEIVKNFILKTLRLQSWEKKIDRFQRGGVMPASFKVRSSQVILHWLSCPPAIKGFDTFPTLLCADGCCMIDRRMVSFSLHIPDQTIKVVLLWLLTAACIKTGRPQIERRALELAESRLIRDSWPEYYDGKHGWYVGKQARKFQTWSVAGFLVAKMMLEDPSHFCMVSIEEDKQMKPVLRRSNSWAF